MRVILSSVLSMAAVGAILAFASAPASAASDPYPWCAQYGRDGGRNCGFVTLQQCLDTISGIGGGCERNTFYTGPESRSPLRHPNPRKPKPRHRAH